MLKIFKNKPYLLILLAILLLSLFFRSYQIVERYGYGHDAELFGWIVKDIVVNHHPRLIGQLTSAEGIFIGPLFYYLLVPFFLLLQMDPIAALIPVTAIGVLTTLSYYFVFSKLFNRNTGLIAAFLQSILLPWVAFDRRIVPSTPTNLWVVWYFYCLIQIASGRFFVLPIVGILIGLIWHIHIALLPTLFALPFAFIAAKKLPKIKEIVISLVALFITSLPLIIFEVKHNFIQTSALLSNFTSDHGAGSGVEKSIYMSKMLSKNIHNLFISPYSLPDNIKPFFTLFILALTIFLIIKKGITRKEIIPIGALFVGVMGFFILSSSPVSEYYIYSLEIIFVSLVSLTLSLIFKNELGKILVILILGTLLSKNLFHFVTDYIYKKDYQERKAIVEFIDTDAKNKGFPCIGINYITTIGENTGFRYFFYLKNTHLVTPSADVAVYSIVLPDELSKEVQQKYGHIGIITPTQIPSKETIQKSCEKPNSNLIDPMFGYVD